MCCVPLTLWKEFDCNNPLITVILHEMTIHWTGLYLTWTFCLSRCQVGGRLGTHGRLWHWWTVSGFILKRINLRLLSPGNRWIGSVCPVHWVVVERSYFLLSLFPWALLAFVFSVFVVKKKLPRGSIIVNLGCLILSYCWWFY